MALGVCLWAPAGVYALGMGDISVQSALNEPLKAEIKLLATTPAELEGLTVQMAPNAAFEKLGVERTPPLANIVFEVIKQGRGAPYVKLSSNRAMREPFLDFVVTVNWANGQMLREYTLLLDPPVFDAEEKAMPVEAPTTSSATIEREQPVVVAPRAQPVAPSAAGSYGPTQRTDTLWTIAKRMRPDTSVGIAQMMVALVKENPEAFMGGNVNGLKAGYILRAPEMDVIGALSKDEAVAETNRQYQQWLASGHRGPNVMAGVRQEVVGQQSATAVEPTAAASSTTAPKSAPTSAASARLKLVTPDETQAASGLGGTGKNGQGGSLQKELAIAQETSEAMRQENSDLRNRVADLEKQIQSMQRLITLKDDTFTALQSGVTQDATPQADAATTPEGITPEVAPKPAPKPTPKTVSQPEPEPSFVDQLLADPKLLGLAVGVPLLLVLGGVAYLRKRRQSAADESIPGGISLESLVSAKPQVKSAAAATVVATSLSTAENEFESAVAGMPEYSTSDIGSIHTEESDIDPIAEADVYLAYRRYEQAEALLKEAIRNHPDRSELRLKLMEIYHATKNKEAFEAQAESLYAMAGGQGSQAWSQAVEMGRELCPEHPLFAEAGATVAAAGDESSPTSSTTDNLEFDVSAAPSAMSDADLAASLDMGDLNLDLPGEINFDLGSEATATKNADLGSSLEQRADDMLSSFASDETVAAEPVAGLGESSEWTLEAAVSEFTSSDLKSEMPEKEHVAVTAVDAEHVEVNKNLGLAESEFDVGDLAVAAAEIPEANQEWSLDQAVSQFAPVEEDLESTVFDSSDDVVGTKLDLARAYIDMGDQAGARTILDEVVVEGSEVQRQEARQLIQQIG